MLLDSWFVLGFTEVYMWLKYYLLIGHKFKEQLMNFTSMAQYRERIFENFLC